MILNFSIVNRVSLPVLMFLEIIEVRKIVGDTLNLIVYLLIQ